MSTLKFLSSILIAIIPLCAAAQRDSTKLSFKEYYLPTGVRIGTDIIPIVRNYSDKTFSGWEASVDVDFYRYFLTAEVGNWARLYHRPDEGLRYANDGNYFRVGIDVNFLKKDSARNMFFLGMRYGHSKFSEHFQFHDVMFDGGDYFGDFTNYDATAHWFELTTGLRVKIWRYFWMGYTARFKFGLSAPEDRALIPHDVPGYGRTDKDSYWGFNYQLLFRIPVRKTPPLPDLGKKKK